MSVKIPQAARDARPAAQRRHGARRGARGHRRGRHDRVGGRRDRRARSGGPSCTTASGDVSTDDVAGAGDRQDGQRRPHGGRGRRCADACTRPRASSAARAWTAARPCRRRRATSRSAPPAGPVEVKATSGNVRLGDLVRRGQDRRTSPATCGCLASTEGNLHVRSVSGDVAVGVAGGVDLHVDVETVSGAVRSEIPLHDTPGETVGREPGWTSASAASRATWRSSGRSNRSPDVQSRSWWQTASSMMPNGSSQNVAK